MKVVVIGLGSMGRRRIRLLRSLSNGPDVVGVDLSEDRRRQAEVELGCATAPDLSAAIAEHNPNAALICTSPLSHGALVMQCLNAGLHVFTEINLVCDWYAEALALAEKKNLKLFISSTFLYRREIEYITQAVRNDTVNYIYHSGQYLPDWHPWENYKDFFVSDKRTNACREILAIEFPWIVQAFGDIESLHVMRGKNSTLDLDFNDNYMISIRHRNGNKGVFCQDVVARKGLRRLEVYSEQQHLFWEGTPESLAAYDLSSKTVRPISLYASVEHREGYNANIIEDAYREELVDFLSHLSGKSTPRHSFSADQRILEMIDGIEKGAYD